MLDLTKERILVTGGHGFLGKHVVRKLEAMGCAVDAPTREACNLLDFESTLWRFIHTEPTVVIHLAALCGGISANESDPAGMIKANSQMAINIMSSSYRRKAKLVAVGSVCSYPADTPIPFKESDLWNGYPEPTNAPYGIAKRVLWQLMDAHHRQYGLKGAFLIPANLYGPGDNFDLETSHVIPALIRKCCEAERISDVPIWGTGIASRDFLYVEDCADAIIRAAECVDIPRPINIGTGEETRIDSLVSKIWYAVHGEAEEFAPCSALKESGREALDGQMRRCLDTSLAKYLMHWEYETRLVTGLRKTVAWYKANGELVIA